MTRISAARTRIRARMRARMRADDAGGGGRGEATDVRDPPREASRRPSTNLNEPQRASTNLVVHRNMFSCAMFDSEAPNMPMNSEQLCPAAA